MHQREAFPLNLLNHNGQNGLLFLLVFRKKNESGAVLTLLWHRYTLQQNELVRYLKHDTCTVARFVVGTFSTSMAHVLKHAQSIVY